MKFIFIFIEIFEAISNSFIPKKIKLFEFLISKINKT